MSRQADFFGLWPDPEPRKVFRRPMEWCRERAAEVRATCAAVAEYYTQKVVAAEMGKSAAALSQALKGENRHRLSDEDVIFFIANDPTAQVRETLWGLGEDDFSDAEVASALRETAMELPAEMHQAFMKKARQRLLRKRASHLFGGGDR